MSKEIAVSVKTLYEWKKTIDIFYKMGHHWGTDALGSPKNYKLHYFRSQKTYFLIANNYEEENCISYAKNSKILHNIFTFRDFLKRYGAKYGIKEELE